MKNSLRGQAEMERRRLACLDALGIPAWTQRADRQLPGAPARAPARQAEAATAPPQREGAVAGMGWEALEAAVAACTLCPLHAGRIRTVFGVGNRQADWLIIGEAPGAEEDRKGEPFVGRAGRLLDAMLEAIGQSRAEVYIANVVKCRPPENRDPRPEEAASCAPYLDRQIALLAPRVILAVGRVAAQRLLGSDTPVGKLRGRVHRHGTTGIPLVVTWHPAYLLRRPDAKAEAWRDLVLASSAARDAAGSRVA